MSIEVKQLTINSVFQRADDATEESGIDKKTEGDNTDKDNARKEQKAETVCLDPDQIKADILAACKKLSRESVNDRLVR